MNDSTARQSSRLRLGVTVLGLVAIVLMAVWMLNSCTAAPEASTPAQSEDAAPAPETATAAPAQTEAPQSAGQNDSQATGEENAEAAGAENGENTGASNAPVVAPATNVAPSTETYKGIPVGFTEEGYPYRGALDAPLVMMEYSDYQCPFCNRYFVQTEPAIDESYVRTGQLRVIFRDFPLAELHPNAPAAHEASLCIAEQGSAALYWEMHAQLFRTVEEWNQLPDPRAFFASLAEEIGGDVEAFQACMEAGTHAQRVQAGVAEARQKGFSGTPSFEFLRVADGVTHKLVGAQPFDQFAGVIDALLAGETPAPPEQQAQQQGDDQGIPYWATAEGLQPDPERPGYDLAGDQYRGDPNATVKVIEFSDFQCPYCRRHVQQTQPALDEQYVETGKVQWVFKHFPLSIHPQAPAAGVASECAAEQGKFWEMHDLIFQNVEAWSIEEPNPVFIDLAIQLELDPDAFAACLEHEEMHARVQSDMNDGAPYVRGTPTFIVLYGNQGTVIPGALPVESFTEILDEALSNAEAR